MRELLGGRAERQPQLLQPARDPDRPALVPEVPLDLADDRRGGVRGELDAAVEVEAVDRLDQADRADLDEVVERLAAAGEPAGEVLDERQVQPDQLVPRRLVLGAVGHRGDELVEELARVRPGGSPGFAHVLVAAGHQDPWLTRTPTSHGACGASR